MPRNKRYWRRHGIAELMNWMMGGLNSDGQYALGKSAKSYRYHCPRWLDYFVTEVGGHALCYSPRSTAALFKKALCPFTLALFEGVYSHYHWFYLPVCTCPRLKLLPSGPAMCRGWFYLKLIPHFCLPVSFGYRANSFCFSCTLFAIPNRIFRALHNRASLLGQILSLPVRRQMYIFGVGSVHAGAPPPPVFGYWM